jgi:2-polyprenyl-3-methyl-5-hydroxy-6-metoxy-1,4-benzoquinol methylase
VSNVFQREVQIATTEEAALDATWHKAPESEARMEPGHAPLWRHFISLVKETDLSEKTVLDFGCNQSGFLRLLHALRPFRQGIGIDIAFEAIKVTKSMQGTPPITHEVATELTPWSKRLMSRSVT